VADRWVPTLGYMLARVDGRVLVMRHGRTHVKQSVPDDEVMLRVVAEAADYDAGAEILRALRADLSGREAGR
jgi:hypothetical protein